MNPSRQALVFIVSCVVVGFLLGLFSAFLASHGEHAIPLMQRSVIALGAAGFITAISGFLRGNKAQGKASSDADRIAKQFTPVAERAVVYVFRDAFYGKFLGIDIALDGVALGQTRGKTYFRLEMAPGEHVLASRNPQDGSVNEHRFTVAACSLTFFEQRLAMGALSMKHEFVAIEAARGAERVRRCRLLVVAGDGVAAKAA